MRVLRSNGATFKTIGDRYGISEARAAYLVYNKKRGYCRCCNEISGGLVRGMCGWCKEQREGIRRNKEAAEATANTPKMNRLRVAIRSAGVSSSQQGT